ncbi:MAG: aminotransferase class V-fold PLP-dependent enzyme [Gemmatimonadaceae bacterium]|nr:aminotransferase class V-fold PLP-dependent enzyme [Gemmatimonadaceae bacterium]
MAESTASNEERSGSPSKRGRRALESYAALQRAAALAAQGVERALTAHDLTGSQIGVLEVLEQRGPVHQQELAETLARSKAQMTAILDGLEKRGFVRRERRTDDRRFIRVELLDAGIRCLALARPVKIAAVQEALRGLDGKERRKLGKLTRRLSRALKPDAPTGEATDAAAEAAAPAISSETRTSTRRAETSPAGDDATPSSTALPTASASTTPDVPDPSDLGFIHRFRPAATPLAPKVLLLLLHGTGGNEEDLLPLADLIAPGAAVLSPRGKSLDEGAPRFFRRLAEGVFDHADLEARTHELATFIRTARDQYGVADLPVVGVGFSNGANILSSLVLRHPGLVRGALLLRGMIPFSRARARAGGARLMAGRDFLYVPGPTNVPDRILRAMHRAQADHRSAEFPALTRRILSRLPGVFGSEQGTAFVFPSTGSAMWEAALVNTLDPGDRILTIRGGQFAHLWIAAARGLGFTVDVIEAPWGTGVPTDALEGALRADAARAIKAVCVVHNETSTGVTSDIASVRRVLDAVGHPAMLHVDGVSAIASIPFAFDAWGVDCAITGSQKGFMLPAGLGILCVSTRALARIDDAKSPRAYFDLRAMRASNQTGYFPYTPPLSLLYGLDESLDLLHEEGLPAVYARHARLAAGTRAAVHAWGLALCARQATEYSPTVSTVMTPPTIDGAKVVAHAFARYRLSLGAGLGELAGKCFRIGHLGDLNELMLVGALAGVEMVLADLGHSVTLGSGVGAALTTWRS